MKNLELFLFVVSCWSCNGALPQSQVLMDPITYNFPENVTSLIRQKVNESNLKIDSFFLALYERGNEYELILSHRGDSDIAELISRSNRIVKINGVDVPLILGTDLQFTIQSDVASDAEFEKIKIIIIKGFSILFEKNSLHKVVKYGYVK